MKDLSKTYNPKSVEDEIYKRWEASGFFNPDNLLNAHDRYWNTEAFSMTMPPPNATGELHMGHALMLTIEDIITRHARMTGYKTLWLPGTDHAAIATQNVVERQLWEKEKKTRHEIGREELLRRIEEFVAKTRGRIQVQIRKLGASCDWSREKYTLSPELSLAVRRVFKQMYEAGLIYRGERLVNWCPRCSTTLSDDEVSYQETRGRLYFVRYPFLKAKGGLVVATTRPETMLADTAVAIHPKDQRYKKFLGQTLMLPLLNRELKIVGEETVDPNFGTGVLKVTPGHDPKDFEIGQRHELEIINLFDIDGKINEPEAFDHGFEDYAGLSPQEAREKIVKELSEQKFLEKVEEINHNLGYCYRCQTVVEPMVSKQWFVNVTAKFKIENSTRLAVILSPPGRSRRTKNESVVEASLKEIALAVVKSGAIKIVPERFTKIYLAWIENLRDWNISRQIWFGHRLPVYYCSPNPSSPPLEEKGQGGCGEMIVSVETPRVCPNCGNPNLIQDPDTLDTWFSSSLWTFSTLGWPAAAIGITAGKPRDLELYHPTTILETGYDILFFWVTRMIMMTGFALENIPFKKVYLHGLVRDIKGKKMSKSKGNIVNPIQILEKYGTDALRLSLIMGTTPGNDLKISEEKIKAGRNFVNKLWNISRFVLQNYKNLQLATDNQKPASLADQWILAELDSLIVQVNKHLADQQFGLAGEALYEFTWSKFADWYLEICKIETNKEELLKEILKTLLKLWHPFIPFVTEEIWSQFNDSLLMVEDFPVRKDPKQKAINDQLMADFESVKSLITGLRNLRAEYQQPPAETFAAYLELPADLHWIKAQTQIIEKLARVKLNFAPIEETRKMPYFLWSASSGKVYLIIPDFDPQKEKALAAKQLKAKVTLTSKLRQQLQQKAFLKKAPPEIVAKLQADFESARQREKQLKAKIEALE